MIFLLPVSKHAIVIMLLMNCFFSSVRADEAILDQGEYMPLVLTQTIGGGSVFTLAGKRVLTEAYGKMGISVGFLERPGERALRQVNEGFAAGVLFRIAGISKIYRNMVQITVPLMVAEARVFTVGHDIKINSWESIRPYHVGLQRGHKFVEFNSQEMLRTVVPHRGSAFKMLQAGRIDITIADRFVGQENIQKYRLSKVKMLSPALAYNPLFHYLNKKHKDMVPRITAVLRGMEKSGRLKTILAEVEANLMQCNAKH